MALFVDTLLNGLRSFLDADYDGFLGFPVDELDAAARWAFVVDTYTGTGALVTPPSAAGFPAKEALQGALAGMSIPGAGPAVMDAAFVLYATTLAAGMLPAFVATPPPPGTLAPALLAQGLLGAVPGGVPVEIQLGGLALVIDTWFRTALAAPSGGGPAVPWA